MTEHRLEGLEPDNLLAFLALLGLLRALEEARPGWAPRVRWDVDAPPTRPVLVLREAATAEAVAAAAAEGVAALARAYDFDRDRFSFVRAEGRALLEAAREAETPGRADLASALLSDAAPKSAKKPDEALQPHPLKLLDVAQTAFFKSLREIVAGAPAPGGKRKAKKNATPASLIGKALFAPWSREDAVSGLRWDPAEDRRHAYAWKAPTDEGTTSEAGANRLAAIGFMALTAVPIIERGAVRLAALGIGRDEAGDVGVVWPIWRAPASLDAIRALLGHPGLDDPETRRRLGVVERRQARRVSAGKYMNVTRADVV